METNKNKKWDENVERCRSLYQERNKSQMVIAGLAMEVCEITRGGSKYSHLYTLKRFAEEVGMSPKLLSSWAAVRKKVFDKLPEAIKADVSYTDLYVVAQEVPNTLSASALTKEFKRIIYDDALNISARKYLGNLRSLHNLFYSKKYAEKGNTKIIEEILFFTRGIDSFVRKSGRKFSPTNHKIASKLGGGGHLSASDAFGIEQRNGEGTELIKSPKGGSVRVTAKDRNVISFLRREKKFFSPTEIGMKAGGHNENSASAWACRTMKKLEELEIIERNKFGHYRWAGD